MIERDWLETKTIIDTESIYYHRVDSWSKKERIIVVEFNAAITFICYMQIIDEEDSLYGTGIYVDQKDYDDNYKEAEGARDTYIRSYRFDENSTPVAMAANTTNTFDFKILDRFDNPATAFLFKGSLELDDHTQGDSLKFQVVDVDVIVYPAGTILEELVNIEVLTENRKEIEPPNLVFQATKQKIPSIFYVRFIYTSVAPTIIPKAVMTLFCQI